MAFIETKANQIIIDQAVASGDYLNLGNGYIPFYGSEFEITFSGNQLYIGTGMLSQEGVKVINDSPITVNIDPISSGTTENKVYLVVDMSDPDNVGTTTSLSTVTLPKDDLFALFDNGIANIEIGTFTLGSSGIIGVNKTIKTAQSGLSIRTIIYNQKTNLTTNTIIIPSLESYDLIMIEYAPTNKSGTNGPHGTVTIEKSMLDNLISSGETIGLEAYRSSNVFTNVRLKFNSYVSITASHLDYGTSTDGWPNMALLKIVGIKL
ncbi:MAG: hypothetical protein ACK5LC_06500 [Coprobacillaceae bacterium]